MTQEEIKVLEQESSALVTEAQSYEVVSQEGYEAAGVFLKDTVKALQKKVADFFDPHIKRAHEVHKALTTDRKAHLDPIEKAEKIVKDKMLTYYQDQKRKEAAAQRRAEEEARKAEEKRKAELEAQAKKHEEKGNVEKAEERREMIEDVHVDTQVVAPKVEKVAGIAVKENWDFEITNKDMLIHSALNEPMLAHIVTIDEKELRKLVKAYKNKLRLAGLKIFDKGSVAA